VAKCPVGLVHQDCHPSGCERTCKDLSGQSCREDAAAASPAAAAGYGQSCFPGCYCPEGTVKEGNVCVTSDKCRNCKFIFYWIIFFIYFMDYGFF